MKLSDVKQAKNLHYGKNLLSFGALDISVRMVITIKHNIYESVETFIRIVGLYLGIVPPACILVLSISLCYGMFTV
jgi:hypothetical protein